MGNLFSRRKFLRAASAATVIPRIWPLSKAFGHDAIVLGDEKASSNKAAGRIVDIHVHFDEKKPNYIDDFLKLSDRLNLTACMLTPFAKSQSGCRSGQATSHQAHSLRLRGPGRTGCGQAS